METKIFKFILKLKRFGRGGVNGEFSLGNSSFGILVFGNSRILCVIAREQSRSKFRLKFRHWGGKASEARNSRFLS